MSDWTEAQEQYILENSHLSAQQLCDDLGGTHGLADAYRKKRKNLLSNGIASHDRARRLGKIADLLERSGIKPEEIGRVEKVRINEWQGMYKDAEGEAHTVDLEGASLLLTPNWADGPKWPVVQPAPPLQVYPVAHTVTVTGNRELAVILPDPQIGYFRDQAGKLHPTHDERALWLAVQVCRAAIPDRVILIGDVIDFPELGRYRRQPAFAATTQATIDRTTAWLADLRANVPTGTSIDWLEGNHEVRIQNYIKDNAAAAFGLKRGNLPDSWPVLSVPVLCRLDELGVQYHAGYPAGTLWVSDRLKIIHGDKATKSGDAHKYLAEERVSLIAGHSHRREWAEQTRHTRHGPRTTLAALPGCLSRIDGMVPSANSGYDLNGVPIESWQNWQQGLAVVSYTPGDGPFALELVPIHHGEAWWRGFHYQAPIDVEGNAA